jgi:hypothetical protein
VIKHVVRMGGFAVIYTTGNFLDDLVADFPPTASRRYFETAIATALFGLVTAITDRLLEKKK